jgi:hypothetical protein
MIGTFQYDAKFWKAVKHLLGGNSKRQVPDLTSADSKSVTTDQEKADVLMNTFADIWTEQESVPWHELGIDNTTKVPAGELCPTAFVFRELCKLDTHKATGQDGISAKFLKGSRYSLAGPITLLINQSLRTGCLPTEWKLGKVIPIFKGGQAQAPGNYRPITLLSITSKIAEKYIRSKLVPVIDPLLPAQQYGFRPGRDTQGALLSVETAIMVSLERCREKGVASSVCVVSFDTRKAFDTVNHRRLLLHLRNHFMVPDWLLRWLHGYIMSRQVYVSVGNANSTRRHVQSGIPQGSVLGPVLHNAAMWRLGSLKLSPTAHCQMYADDVVLVKPIIIPTCGLALQLDCQAITQLVQSEGMSMNVSKTQAMCVSLAPTPAPPPYLSIDGVDVSFADELTYLGVRFDRRLTMRAHIDKVTGRAKRKLGALHSVLRRYRGVGRQLGHVWRTQIEPILMYSTFIFFGRTAGGDNALEHVQRMAARCTLNRYDLPTNQMFKRLKWQSIKSMAMSQRSRLMYSYWHQIKPRPPELFSTCTERRVSTRNKHNKQMFPFKTCQSFSIMRKSAVNQMCQQWNSLPQQVVDQSESGFRVACKNM